MNKNKIEYLILGLAIFTLLFNSVIQTYIINKNTIMGFYVSEDNENGSVKLCVLNLNIDNLTQNFSHYDFNGVISGSERITTTILNPLPDEKIKQQFRLLDVEHKPIEDLGSNYEGSYTYSLNFDSTKYPDKNCYYFIESVVLSNRNGCSEERYANGTGAFSINNINAPPKWDQFKNENSTDFDSYTEWTNISNARLYKPKVGCIQFGPEPLNFEQADLDSKIIFKDKYLKIEREDLYCLADVDKTVTFFNVSFILPTILYDGTDCGEVPDVKCEVVNYNKTNKTLIIRINKHGEYRIIEGVEGVLKLSSYGIVDNKTISEKYYSFPILLILNYSIPAYFNQFDEINCSLKIIDDYTSKIVYTGLFQLNSTEPNETISSGIYTHVVNKTIPIATYVAEAFCQPNNQSNVTLPPKKAYNKFRVNEVPTRSIVWSDTQPTTLNTIYSYENTTMPENESKKYSININDSSDTTKTLYNNNISNIYFIIYRDILTNDTTLTTSKTIERYICNISWGDNNYSKDYALNNSKENITILIYDNNSGIYIPHNIELSKASHKYRWPGDYEVSYNCWDINKSFGYLKGKVNVTITNRKPVLAYKIPDVTWPMDSAYSPYKLKDYFYDPDGESLVYSYLEVPNIAIYIANDSAVVLIPDKGFIGSRITFFTATDPHGAYVNSNLVNLTVVGEEKYEYKNYTSDQALPGEPPLRPLCQEKWNCTPWGKCMPSGIQVRECVDLNNCNTTFHKPPEWRHCIYTPTCNDGIKNQNETGVDCGGPCPPCPSCNNGIKDRNEEGVDCGGPCPPCPSCYDGIQNQGEEGIDCGGPCPPCKEKQKPGLIQTVIINHLNEIIVISSLLIVTLSFLSLLFKKIHSFNRFVIKIINKLINLFSLPSFEEYDVYAELLLKANRLEKRAKHIRTKDLIKKIDDLFKQLIKNFLLLEEEKSYDELQEIIPKLHLNEVDKLLLKYITIQLDKLEFSEEKTVSKKNLISLIKKIKILIERNKHLLIEIQINKEIENLESELKTNKDKALLEKRILLNLFKELLLINEKIQQRKLIEALRIYKQIKKLYSKLNILNRIKVYNQVNEMVKKLRELIKEYKQKALNEYKNKQSTKTVDNKKKNIKQQNQNL